MSECLISSSSREAVDRAVIECDSSRLGHFGRFVWGLTVAVAMREGERLF